MDFAALRRFVESEIDSYVYQVPDGALGRACSAEWVAGQIAEMRASLVKPEWVQVELRDTEQQLKAEFPVMRPCVRVARDQKGYELYYDPEAGEFVLAFAGTPPQTFNVRGDAVGCFMAR